MIIEFQNKVFKVYGFPVIEDRITKAYAFDEHNELYLLIWSTRIDLKEGHVNIVKIDI